MDLRSWCYLLSSSMNMTYLELVPIFNCIFNYFNSRYDFIQSTNFVKFQLAVRQLKG